MKNIVMYVIAFICGMMRGLFEFGTIVIAYKVSITLGHIVAITWVVWQILSWVLIKMQEPVKIKEPECEHDYSEVDEISGLVFCKICGKNSGIRV